MMVQLIVDRLPMVLEPMLGLPPNKDVNHAIYLIPSTKLVNFHPYCQFYS